MPLTEAAIIQLEAQIPELSRKAFGEAYQRALASGHPVTLLAGDEGMQLTRAGGRRVVAEK